MVAVLLGFCKAPRNDEIALQHIFFLACSSARIFFYFICAACSFFFFQQALAGILFFSSPTKPPPPPPLKKKIYVAQQNFCSRVLLPHIKLVLYERASSRGKSVARLFQEQAPSCVLKFACRNMTCLPLANQIGFFFHPQQFPCPNRVVHLSAPSSCPSCVLAWVLTREA